jgi:hypothetical protein
MFDVRGLMFGVRCSAFEITASSEIGSKSAHQRSNCSGERRKSLKFGLREVSHVNGYIEKGLDFTARPSCNIQKACKLLTGIPGKPLRNIAHDGDRRTADLVAQLKISAQPSGGTNLVNLAHKFPGLLPSFNVLKLTNGSHRQTSNIHLLTPNAEHRTSNIERLTQVSRRHPCYFIDGGKPRSDLAPAVLAERDHAALHCFVANDAGVDALAH